MLTLLPPGPCVASEKLDGETWFLHRDGDLATLLSPTGKAVTGVPVTDEAGILKSTTPSFARYPLSARFMNASPIPGTPSRGRYWLIANPNQLSDEPKSGMMSVGAA